MKLLLAVAAAANAQLTYNNWDLAEANIHWNYRGGLREMVYGLAEDYGYPAEFLLQLEPATDALILGTVSGWTSNDIKSIREETASSNSAWNFYAGELSAMTGVTISRDDLKATMETFITDLVANTDDATLTTIMDAVATFAETANTAAVDYVTDLGTLNATNAQLVQVLKPIKSAINEFNSGVDNKLSVGTTTGNTINMILPAINYALQIYETGVDRHFAGIYAYDQIMNFMDNVVYDPLIIMCEGGYGPFGTLTHMIVVLSHFFGSMEEVIEYSQEIEAWTSMIVFGDETHFGFNWVGFFEEYLFQYTQTLNPHGGWLEAQTHILAITLDPVIKDAVFNMVKGPVCGIEDPVDA